MQCGTVISGILGHNWTLQALKKWFSIGMVGSHMLSTFRMHVLHSSTAITRLTPVCKVQLGNSHMNTVAQKPHTHNKARMHHHLWTRKHQETCLLQSGYTNRTCLESAFFQCRQSVCRQHGYWAGAIGKFRQYMLFAGVKSVAMETQHPRQHPFPIHMTCQQYRQAATSGE